jgi:uncharacterized protein YdeI (YjbR/CyaY-like superfamily)
VSPANPDFLPNKDNVKAFKTPAAWGAWLKTKHARSTGLWVRLYKKNSGIPSIDYAQTLDEALCWGWIDGQKRGYDEQSFLQRFSPRGPRSPWSQINRTHIARLIKEKRMQAPGLAQVKAAQADGRWDKAYESQSTAEVPADFLKALSKDKKALAFFKTLNKANLYAIHYRLHTAKKPETRARRFEQCLQMMKEGKRFH